MRKFTNKETFKNFNIELEAAELNLNTPAAIPSAHSKLSAHWTGAYPCLCSGRWELTCTYPNGDTWDLSVHIPEEYISSPMGTHNTYAEVTFANNWEEIWSTYEDGESDPDKWASERPWVSEISSLYNIPISEIYDAFQSQDWRHGSCGGCI